MLEGTDWLVAEGSSGRQKTEEPGYECTLTNAISSPTNIDNNTTGSTIAQGSEILVYYNPIMNCVNSGIASGSIDLEFLYAIPYRTDLNSQLVINGTHYIKKNLTYEVDATASDPIIVIKNGNTILLTIYYLSGVSGTYRAERLINKVRTIYDPIVERYVEVYSAKKKPTSGVFKDAFYKDDTIYHYTTTEFENPAIVNNLMVNSSGFLNANGWVSTGADKATFTTKLYPEYYGGTTNYDPKGYLIIPKVVKSSKVRNRGLSQFLSFLPNGIQKGDKFIFRIRAYKEASSGAAPDTSALATDFLINIIRATDSTYYLSRSGSEVTTEDGLWREIICIASKSISYNELKTGEYLFQFPAKSDSNLWIEDIQFFPLRYGPKPVYKNGSIVIKDGEVVTEEVRMEPGDMDFLTLSKEIHCFYNYSQFGNITSKDDLVYIYKDTKNNSNYSTLMNLLSPNMTNYQKISSIQISKSNRFNILQQIAETFKCWCIFTIQHYESGEISNKQVKFVEEVGEETGFGFEYRTDLKSVSRTIQSEQFTTKIIVPNNSNEFGVNGFCSIARSELNYPKTNYILNFDYYINHAMIDGADFVKDLYDEKKGIGYYSLLNTLNTNFDEISEKLSSARLALAQRQADYDTASKAIIAIDEKIADVRNELVAHAGGSYWIDSATKNYLEKDKKEINVVSRQGTLQNLQASREEKDKIATSAQKSIASLTKEISGYETKLAGITASIENINAKFETKYRSFIREGTWQDEGYYDDNLYYLDAQEVAYTSSRPQVSYNIAVLRLSALEEFEAKVFKIGDIAYVQDEEFFGYQADGITPYREKVVITEITSYFDEPEKDNITVQNYRTQFEDLFQRITASVQALQYNSGSYARAANAVTEGGALTDETIKKTFGDKVISYTVQNENIKQDQTGITVSDITSPNLKTWLSPTGLKITEDGGFTWRSAISGNGIETDNLTSGAIYTNQIAIMDGEHTTFRWNEEGVTAYEPLPLNLDGSSGGVNKNKFTRFDYYGIYGIDMKNEYQLAINRNFGSDTYFYETTESGKNKYKKAIGTPTNGVSYYLLGEEGVTITVPSTSGSNLKASMWLQANGEPRLEDGNYVYLAVGSSDATQYGLTYYNVIAYQFDGNAPFDEVETYYEQVYISEAGKNGYKVTEDEERDTSKTYYYFEPTEEGFPDYPIYYKDTEDYVLVELFDNYDNSKLYYTLEITGTMPATFDPGETYYDCISLQDNTYASQRTSDEVPQSGKAYGTRKNFAPASLDEIEKAADYGMTWDGFFLKSKGRDGEENLGLVKISSDEDIRVKSSTGQGEYIDRIIIGRLYKDGYIVTKDTNPIPTKSYYILNDNTYTRVTFEQGESFNPNVTYYEIGEDFSQIPEYGIRINNRNGSPVLVTGENGDLWLKEALYIGDGSNQNIKLGFFSDEDSDEREIFSAVTDVGSFIIHADGTIDASNGNFSGVIHATDGEFTGTITADEGNIGGFNIGPTQLTSSDDTSLILDSTGKITAGGIFIDGTNSTIQGTNFYISPTINKFNNVQISGKLSTTVFETNHVQAVGGAMIFKPSYNVVGEPEETQVTIEEVTKTAWNIALDGENDNKLQYIEANDYILMSYGTPSVESEVIYKEFTAFGNITGKVISKNGNIITVYVGPYNDENNIKDIISVVVLGDGVDNNRAIGINSNTNGIEGLLQGEGLTISTFEISESDSGDLMLEPSFKPNLFLGNLSNVTDSAFTDMGGFGLYADNVYLRGALTTVNEANKYTGVNTASKINVENNGRWGTGTENPGNIIFWGGAKDNTEVEIKNSPFFVTDQGCLFAQSGYFTGTIITNSTIEATEIRTARIYGTGKDKAEEVGLILYNSENIISFRNKYLDSNKTKLSNEWDIADGYEEEVFYIGTKGFFQNRENPLPFITIGEGDTYIETQDDEPVMGKRYYTLKDNIYTKWTGSSFTSGTTYYELVDGYSNNENINFYGKKLGIKTAKFYGDIENLRLQIDDYISFKKLNTGEDSSGQEIEQSYIKLRTDNRFNIAYQNTNLLLDENSIELSSTETGDLTNIYFGNSENGGTLKFTHVDNGFDVYVQ